MFRQSAGIKPADCLNKVHLSAPLLRLARAATTATAAKAARCAAEAGRATRLRTGVASGTILRGDDLIALFQISFSDFTVDAVGDAKLDTARLRFAIRAKYPNNARLALNYRTRLHHTAATTAATATTTSAAFSSLAFPAGVTLLTRSAFAATAERLIDALVNRYVVLLRKRMSQLVGRRLIHIQAHDIHAGIGPLAVEKVGLDKIFEDDVGMAAIGEFGNDGGDFESFGSGRSGK